MTNEEWQRWWNTEWQEQRLAIQKWQPPAQPPKSDTWDPVYGYCFDPEKLKEYQDANFPIYVGANKWDAYRRDAQRDQQQKAQKKQLPQLEQPDEMRYRMASASNLDSKLPGVFPATANAVGTGIGSAIGGLIMALLLIIGIIPCIAFIGAAFIFLPLPGVIIGLLIWAACAADTACTRSIIREELKQHEKNKTDEL